ncbi:hypothetical protein CIRMBP1229_01872 [Enterococcus cecorum]|nr:hypothetical protein CIRMBP1229_01872 [Enterococcus cecorum]
MLLSTAELSDLTDEITERLPLILSNLNRTGGLNEWLAMGGMSDLVQGDKDLNSYPNGKIVVIGGTDIKEKVFLGVAKELGLSRDRFEFCLDYKKIQKYEFNKLQYNSNYRVVLFGPAPHSSQGKGKSSSVITEMEKSQGYPRAIRLQSSNELKISKTNFREALKQLIEEKYIVL